MEWIVATRHPPAEREVTGDIVDWDTGIIETPEFSDVVG
jgi:hypothetical protein